MSALIVYETIWGNTAQVAQSIAAGLGGGDAARVVPAGAAPTRIPDDADLLVVGGPTHAFSMSTTATRASAAERGATDIPDRGIREWLEILEAPARHVPVATFDTRVAAPRLPGSAAGKALKRLARLGFRIAAKPITFRVHGYEGPLVDGEQERARAWGATLGQGLPEA